MMFYRYICPIIPRRHTHLLGEFIDAINSTSAVATCNNQLIVNQRDNELLTFAFQQRGIEFMLFDKTIDEGRLA